MELCCLVVMPLGPRGGVRNMWFHISWIFAPKASLRDFWIVLVGLVGPNSYGGGVDP